MVFAYSEITALTVDPTYKNGAMDLDGFLSRSFKVKNQKKAGNSYIGRTTFIKEYYQNCSITKL